MLPTFKIVDMLRNAGSGFCSKHQTPPGTAQIRFLDEQGRPLLSLTDGQIVQLQKEVLTITGDRWAVKPTQPLTQKPVLSTAVKYNGSWNDTQA